MGTGINDILGTFQQAVQAINNLTSQIKTTFPQASSLSTSATTGAITFSSSQPAAFLSVTTSSGGVYKVPLFS